MDPEDGVVVAAVVEAAVVEAPPNIELPLAPEAPPNIDPVPTLKENKPKFKICAGSKHGESRAPKCDFRTVFLVGTFDALCYAFNWQIGTRGRYSGN